VSTVRQKTFSGTKSPLFQRRSCEPSQRGPPVTFIASCLRSRTTSSQSQYEWFGCSARRSIIASPLRATSALTEPFVDANAQISVLALVRRYPRSQDVGRVVIERLDLELAHGHRRPAVL
jgi:hypothetical protein